MKKKSAKKIFTIGSATQDIFLHIAPEDILETKINGSACIAFEEGSKLYTQGLHYATGGGATNVAAALTLLEHKVYPICKIAQDAAGAFILNDLTSRKIPTDYIKTNSDKPTALSYILPAPSGNHVILVARGANAKLQAVDVPFDVFEKSDALYIMPLANDLFPLLLKIAQYARTKDLFVTLNPGRGQLTNGSFLEILQYIDIFLLNKKEAEVLSKTMGLNVFSLENYAQKILQRGPTIVVVTLGAEGVFIATKEQNYTFSTPKVCVKNSVGAGDAFGATFFGMLLHGKSIEEAAQTGLRNSTAILQGKDAKDGLLSLQELNQK